MRRLILFLLTVVSTWTYAQGVDERVLYVVDSVAIVDDPKDNEGSIAESDVETLTVVTNKDDIERYGYNDIDKIIFIITKAYSTRSAEIKKIPTTKNMERKNGQWHLSKSTIPYSGQFVDYFLNGKKQGDGTLKNGVLDGRRNVYYQNGNLKYYTHYVNGIETGESKEYFMNGTLHQEGNFNNGKDDGTWKEWYSTGALKRQTQFKDGDVVGATKEQDRFHKLLSNGIAMSREENYQGAIKAYDKAIELNPNYSDLYFHRGTAYLYDFKFDEAIKDYDKAIELEPLYMIALSNRAFARLRKYEFKNSRTLSKGNGVTVLAAKDKVDIPKDEIDKICADLNKGLSLGDNKPMILDAIKNYCK
jgi:antitoxin component YwqK of YwqJK toxin-antitoxin module